MIALRSQRGWARPLSSVLLRAGRPKHPSPSSCPILFRTYRGLRDPSQGPRLPQPSHPRTPPQEPAQTIDSDRYGYRGPDEDPAQSEIFLPPVKVRYLRPAIWALCVSAGVYVLLAYMEAREELKPQPWNNPLAIHFQVQRRTAPTPTEVVTRAWDELTPISKLSWGIIATNSAVHLTSFVVPRYWHLLWHTPALNASAQLFTSTWVHAGAFHLLFNMWACHNFLPPTGHSRLFDGDAYHTLSFYLGAGLLSGYAQHLSTLFARARPGVPAIWTPSGGASGALFAIFGAFCTQFPDAGVGIVFVPYYVDAQYFLPAIMLFDFIGMVRGYSFVNFGHAAHLAGASIGVAYSYFDGKTRIWRPLVNSFKRRLQRTS